MDSMESPLSIYVSLWRAWRGALLLLCPSVRPTDIQRQRMKGRKEKEERGRRNQRAFTASLADDTESPLRGRGEGVSKTGSVLNAQIGI